MIGTRAPKMGVKRDWKVTSSRYYSRSVSDNGFLSPFLNTSLSRVSSMLDGWSHHFTTRPLFPFHAFFRARSLFSTEPPSFSIFISLSDTSSVSPLFSPARSLSSTLGNAGALHIFRQLLSCYFINITLRVYFSVRIAGKERIELYKRVMTVKMKKGSLLV